MPRVTKLETDNHLQRYARSRIDFLKHEIDELNKQVRTLRSNADKAERQIDIFAEELTELTGYLRDGK